MSKTFFESLNPKSALITGVVGGFLVICAVGFFILLGVMLNGEAVAEKGDTVVVDTTDNRGQVEPVAQAPKSDKPVVELFVMSHCPYGLQAEKAYLPVWNLLKDETDMSLRFVNYAMHDLKEVEEQTRQLCVAEQGEEKIISYLQCFTLADTPDKCLSEAKVNTSKIDSCSDRLDSEFGIMDAYNDKASWLSGRFPIFPVHDDLNKKYGVQGSPTLVINGEQIKANRSPEAIKQVICKAFNKEPKECETVLSSAAVSPSFGSGTAGDQAAAADCGV